tara:strand:+ start:5129 stop:6517 length:1389 start_codon:yes stop_codon:yes gene_type:complete
MKKRIYLLIEILKREIDARLYFASIASDLNYSVVIGHKGVLWERLKYLRPGLVIFKSIGPRNTKMMNLLKKYGHQVAAYDEEMFINYDVKDAVERRIYPNSMKELDYFFSWGEEDKNTIIKKFPSFRNKIFSTGNPRVDILKDKNNKVFKEEAEKIKSKYGNFILFTSSFSKINENLPQERIGHVFNMVAMGKDIHSRELEVARNWRALLQNDLEYFIKFIQDFDKNFPNKKLIVRPHPAENEKFWFGLTKNLKNVITVSDNLSTNAWILASDLLIGHNDTTIIEASFLNKPVLNFIPCKDYPSVEYNVLKNFTKTVRSIEELNSIIKNENFDDYFVKNVNEDNLSIFLKNFPNNQCSVKNIISVIKSREKEFERFKTNDLKVGRLFLFFYELRGFLKQILKKVLFFKKKDKRVERRKTQKFGKGISIDEIKKKFNKIIHKDQINDFRVKKIFPHIFLIEKK